MCMFKYIVLLFYFPYIFYLQQINTDLHQIFAHLKGNPFGKLAFSAMLGFTSPYSGSIEPMVEEFHKGKTKCVIVENRSVKKPFNSIHALALTNLGEISSGLLMMDHMRSVKKKGIITKITTDFHKKARGKITAISNIESLDHCVIKSDLYDANNDLVCEVFCTWKMKELTRK